MQSVLEARHVSKRFLLRHNRAGELKVRFLSTFGGRAGEVKEEFWALRDISVRLARGESLGLVGRNGSGKSTFLKLIAAIYRPTEGAIWLARGARITTMIELGVGFHPELTGRENVLLSASVHGLSRADIEALYPSILAYAGLEHFMDVPLKNYSSGMHMRLGFAVAANLEPDILLLDEIFAVGDEPFQQKCMGTLTELQRRGCTILFVSHSAPAIRAICHRVCVLHRGELGYDGGVEAGLAHYRRLVAADAAASTQPDAATSPDPDRPWHRDIAGGKWDEAGVWEFEFLRQQGLQPHHHVLDVGCGSLSAARFLLPFMEQGHYWGFEQERALFDAGVRFELSRAGVPVEWGYFVVNDTFDFSGVPHEFDFAIANSLFARLPIDALARCLVAVVSKLRPGGRFFATWHDNPDLRNTQPIARASGQMTFPDRAPYHYGFELIAALCRSIGATVEPLDDTSHPRGESVLLIRRAARDPLPR